MNLFTRSSRIGRSPIRPRNYSEPDFARGKIVEMGRTQVEVITARGEAKEGRGNKTKSCYQNTDWNLRRLCYFTKY